MILYTPLPPQLTVQHTVTQMARLDRRFDRPELLRGDPALLVQDSARLLNAYLVLCAPHGEWRGDPLAPAGGLHLTEGAWRTGLGLDSVATVHVGPAHLTPSHGCPAHRAGALIHACALRRASELIAGKPVNPVRVYLSLVILAMAALISGSLIYSAVRSALIAIGRNPLSKKSIIRGLFQVVLIGLMVFLIKS